MQVTSETKFAAFQPFVKYLKKGELDKIRKQAPFAVIGRDGYLSLTIADFNAIAMHGDLSRFTNGKTDFDITVYDYYTIEGLHDFFEGFAKDLEKFAMKPDAKEQKAQNACYKVGVVESMLIFVRDYFGLRSFAEAERVTLADLLIARKDAYNKAAFEKAYQAQFKNTKRR